jgi:DNA invertase Pin-like site-specific DNA recombinase
MKAAIYVRLSEEDRDKKSSEDDSQSIQNQKALLLQHAINHGWDVVEIYNDDDYRGTDRMRPEWNRLLKDAEQRKFDVILCKTQSRFTREMEMVEKYIHHLFPLWGIRFIGVADNADTANKGNKKQRQIMGLTNEWYLEDMSDSIKAALDTRRRQGFHIGSFPLYGYVKDSENKGKLIIDPEAADVVREVFNLYAQGNGKTHIAKLLNARGIPNPTEYKRVKGIRYKTPKHQLGTLWKYYAIGDMLVNELYIGNMVQGKYGSVSYKTGENKPRPKEQWIRVENTHEPIINIELWERVQELVKLKAKPFATGITGLFARKAKCIYCGYTMRTTKSRDKYYLKCGTKHIATGACIGSFVSVEALEQSVLSELNALLDEHMDADEVSRGVKLSDNITERIVKLEADKNACTKKSAEYSKAVRSLYLDKVKGVITEEDFIELSREFSQDRERLEATVKSIDNELAMLVHKNKAKRDKRQIVAEYGSVGRLDRVMVEKLIDHVRVGKREKGMKHVPVEIHWNF